MEKQSMAAQLFARIGDGAEKAVKRPGSGYDDRVLRKMISTANNLGDCIICGDSGYYRPRPWIKAEEREARRYFASELNRGRDILHKRTTMVRTYNFWRESGELVACMPVKVVRRPKRTPREIEGQLSIWDEVG